MHQSISTKFFFFLESIGHWDQPVTHITLQFAQSAARVVLSGLPLSKSVFKKKNYIFPSQIILTNYGKQNTMYIYIL